jgi:tripartite-type tricarboxylate transporter receptor subunit TctC
VLYLPSEAGATKSGDARCAQTQSILPHLFAKLPYDPAKDFTPITNIVASANILIVHPAVPATARARGFLRATRPA